MKIGIYGGTFNPPHLGHLAAARRAVEALGLDKLIFVPAGIPPHKPLPETMPTQAQRLELTAIAADQLRLPEITDVWDEELKRPGKSYTSDTLRQAAERWPGAELWLLVGTDMFLTLQDWHEPEVVLSLAGVCAFGRSRGDEDGFARQKKFLEDSYGARIEVITIPELVEVSSSQLRAGLATGVGREFLPQAVYGYILREKLYGTSADLSRLNDEDLRCASYSMVKAKRLPHIRGTEEEAVRLAQRWGADIEKMRRAAILHDCTKYLSLEEHLAICRKYGVELDEMERVTEKLLHSKTGAILARHWFGQDDEIYEAIFYHTTARANMSLGEKILYMADYIEPNRDFPEVEELRALSYTDLDRAVGMGAELAIQEMVERGRQVHHNTTEAYECYWKGTGT
jgi:nicotinate-nucleotide adenylyltransferase